MQKQSTYLVCKSWKRAGRRHTISILLAQCSFVVLQLHGLRRLTLRGFVETECHAKPLRALRFYKEPSVPVLDTLRQWERFPGMEFGFVGRGLWVLSELKLNAQQKWWSSQVFFVEFHLV